MNETEKRMFHQALMDATRRDQYKQCLVSAECPDPVVKGHSVPVSYLKRLPGSEGKMMVFNRFRFGELRPHLPMEEGINYASTGYFTCQPHDGLFQPADGIADIEHMPNCRTMNLVCYRNVLLARWWMELWARAAEEVDDKLNKPIQRGINERLRRHSQELRQSQNRLESCVLDTNHYTCTAERCEFIEHLIFVSDGPPVLAAAQFGVPELDSDRLGQWGLTLIPGNQTNAICLHYSKDVGTRAMDRAFPSIAKGKSTLTGQEVSQALLKFCSDIIFSEATWLQLNPKEQATVEQAMSPWEKKPAFDVDLFKGSPWKII